MQGPFKGLHGVIWGYTGMYSLGFRALGLGLRGFGCGKGDEGGNGKSGLWDR